MKYQSTINIRNASGRTLTFHLEPWGDEIEMRAGAIFAVTAEAERQGSFEVEHDEGKITVWAWPSAVVKVFRGDEEVWPGAGIELPAVPPVPSGESVSSFLRGILGKGGDVSADDEI
jgi:hypothetical protein